MWILVLGLILFFAVHSVRMLAPNYREGQVRANPGRWKGVYSLLSLIGLVLIVWGWSVYRPEAPQLYDPPEWGRHVAWVLVLFGLIAIVATYAPPGRIGAALRHPFLVAVMLWALAHLLANGDAASALLFGSFLVYAVADRLAVGTRPGERSIAISPTGDLIAVFGGLAVYLVLMFWLHQILFGVSPLA